MIDKNFLRNYSLKSETGFENIIREYVQHLFLRSFYSKNKSEQFLFKGGTALRLVFGSPRFSEDLDFTGLSSSIIYEDILESVLLTLADEGIDVDLIESKKTTGGHLGSIRVVVFDEEVEIGNHVSFRKKSDFARESVVVSSELAPNYSLYLLNREILVAEKLEALMSRAKPRDYFDLYFFLRNLQLRSFIKLDENKREEILANLEKTQKESLERELRRFLPKSFWQVIKDLPEAIKKELI